MNNIGIVVGIFDIVSLDKLNFLNAAAAECGFLTVGILSNNVSKEVTGKFPIMDEKSRAGLFEEFKSVGQAIVIDSLNDVARLSEKFDKVFIYDDIKSNDKIKLFDKNAHIKVECKFKTENDYKKIKSLEGTIGYTTGVYDLFHIGHLNLIKRAKACCDSLVVGVSTDELVREYKNKVPNMSFSERIQIIENLKCVDAVVVQETMDKFLAWQKLKFNIIFHGDDWKGSPLYEENEKKLKAVGVDMVYFPYTKGISSTILSKEMDKK